MLNRKLNESWEKPWFVPVNKNSAVTNFKTEYQYKNGNFIFLLFSSMFLRFTTLQFMTFKQGLSLGYMVIKGSDGLPVYYDSFSYYKMKNGILREGDAADMITVKNLIDFEVVQTYIDGILVAEQGKPYINSVEILPLNKFNCSEKKPADFIIFPAKGQTEIDVIEALEGQLITNRLVRPAVIKNELIIADTDNDILKIVVVNRYTDAPVAISFIKNIGLTKGAIASSVAHDSHNIVAVGVDDESICRAVNLVVKERGGISAVSDEKEMILPLPVGGLMSVTMALK